VNCNGLTQEELSERLTQQAAEYIGWIKQHGGEKIKIDVTVNNANYGTKNERLNNLKSIYDIAAIEKHLSCMLI
jgi:hypothetical protein